MNMGKDKKLDDRLEAPPVIVFDGECVLCSTQAQFVLRHDTMRKFHFTVAQGETGHALYRRLGLKTDVHETILLVDGDRVLMRSDAVIAIARGLGWPWRALSTLAILPRPVRDGLYRLVANNRYRWFGKRDTCWRPTPDVADRIL